MSEKITIIMDSLERLEPVAPLTHPFYRIVFKTSGRVDEFEFPILVYSQDCREDDAVRIGKSYLAHSLASLAEMTKEWVLSEDERTSLRPHQPTTP